MHFVGLEMMRDAFLSRHVYGQIWPHDTKPIFSYDFLTQFRGPFWAKKITISTNFGPAHKEQ